MKKTIQALGMILLASITAALITVSVAGAKDKKNSVPAPVAQTGQTECWDANGAPIACTGTGQDGDVQAGVVSPVPRFTDNGDGTVTDNLTGLTWLQNKWCKALGESGWASWEGALAAANSLQNEKCGLSDGSLPGDWRIPNARELLSLVDFGSENILLPVGHPFTYDEGEQNNALTVPYWTSTTYADQPYEAFLVDFFYGEEIITANLKDGTWGVWPVKGGK